MFLYIASPSKALKMSFDLTSSMFRFWGKCLFSFQNPFNQLYAMAEFKKQS